MKCILINGTFTDLFAFLSAKNYTFNSSVKSTILANWEAQSNQLSIAYLCSCAILIMTNIAVIHGIKKTQSARETPLPQKLFLYSAKCGFLNGIFIPCYFIASIMAEDNCLVEGLIEVILEMFSLGESGFLTTLAVVRFISVKWPLLRPEERKMKIIIIVEMVSFVSLPIINFLWLVLGQDSNEYSYWLFSGAFLIVILAVGVVLSGLLIYALLTRPALQNRRNVHSVSQYHRRWKPIQRVILLQITHIACLLPYTIFAIKFGLHLEFLTHAQWKPSMTIDVEGLVEQSSLSLWFYLVMVMYSAVNSIIYIFHYKDVRTYFSNLAKRPFNGRHNRVGPAVTASSDRESGTKTTSENKRNSKRIAPMEEVPGTSGQQKINDQRPKRKAMFKNSVGLEI